MAIMSMPYSDKGREEHARIFPPPKYTCECGWKGDDGDLNVGIEKTVINRENTHAAIFCDGICPECGKPVEVTND